ncbi:MAG TPA: hypothetical protein PKE29_17120 [Phycisphaerales bacterium]|nr:hypothetical protein [Phycisphaerales bacterium]
MNVSVVISDVIVTEVGKGLVERLCRLYPEGGDGKYSFRIVLPENDPRVSHILQELKAAGLSREPTGKWKAYKPGKEFSFTKTIRYDEADYAGARFISWRLRGWHPQFDEQNTDAPDPAVRLLALEESTKKWSFAGTDFGHLIATMQGRRMLDDGTFVGVSYVPAYFVDERSDVAQLRDLIAKGSTPSLGEPSLWEVRPSVVLPPMLPLAFTHMVNGEHRLSRNPIDVDYRMAYAKADLDKVGPFDFARPHPGEDSKRALVDPLVVSQRFFQLMKKQEQFDLSQWTPVREE